MSYSIIIFRGGRLHRHFLVAMTNCPLLGPRLSPAAYSEAIRAADKLPKVSKQPWLNSLTRQQLLSPQNSLAHPLISLTQSLISEQSPYISEKQKQQTSSVERTWPNPNFRNEEQRSATGKPFAGQRIRGPTGHRPQTLISHSSSYLSKRSNLTQNLHLFQNKPQKAHLARRGRTKQGFCGCHSLCACHVL